MERLTDTDTGALAMTDVLGVVRRHWVVLLVGVVAGLAVGTAYFVAAPRTYSASATVTVNALGDPLGSGSPVPPSMATEQTVVSSGAVASGAADALGISANADELTEHLSVTSPRDSQVLVITYDASTRQAAAATANAFAESYLGYRASQAEDQYGSAANNIEDQLRHLRKKLAKTERRLNGLSASSAKRSAVIIERDQLYTQIGQLQAESTKLAAYAANPGEVVDRATAARSASSPRLVVTTAAGLVVGVLLAAGLVVWREFTNTPLRGRADAERRLRRPVLAVIDGRRRHRGAEGYQVAAVKLIGASPPASILVTAGDSRVARMVARWITGAVARFDIATTLIEVSPPLGAPLQLPRGVKLAARQPTPSSLDSDEPGVVVTATAWQGLAELLLLVRSADMVVPVVVSGEDRRTDVRETLAELDEAGTQVPGVILLESRIELQVKNDEPVLWPATAAEPADIAGPR